MIFNYFENEKKLLFFEHGVDEIPDEIIKEYSAKDVIHVDFSSNSLSSLNCITHFSNLREVIFDNNFLSDATMFPKRNFPNVDLLSINKNKFENLEQLLNNLVRCFPNLRYLSLLGNAACPALLQDYSEEDYREYRLLIIRRMPKLKFLDAKQVDKSELSIMQPAAASTSQNDRQSPPDSSTEKMEKFGKFKKFFGFTSKSSNRSGASVEQKEAYSPLPRDNIDSSKRSYYGKVKNRYEGSQSQGNRFILNQDL